jgi:hypothetical protein
MASIGSKLYVLGGIPSTSFWDSSIYVLDTRKFDHHTAYDLKGNSLFTSL